MQSSIVKLSSCNLHLQVVSNNLQVISKQIWVQWESSSSNFKLLSSWLKRSEIPSSCQQVLLHQYSKLTYPSNKCQNMVVLVESKIHRLVKSVDQINHDNSRTPKLLSINVNHLTHVGSLGPWSKFLIPTLSPVLQIVEFSKEDGAWLPYLW